MRFREWLEKAKYKTWFGELCGNTFSLTLALAFISFLNVATEGTIMAIAATSFWWSWKARWNPFRSGFFPALISTSLLQLGYFVSGADLIPVNIMITMFIGNLILISALAGIFSGIGKWLRNRKIRKIEQGKKDIEEKTSHFSDNLKRLAIVTLFFYIQMFIAVPLIAKVSAESTGTQISSDDFIENYDPENTYTTKSKIPDIKPKRRVPLESPYGNITGAELEQLEAFCQTNGCDLTTVASQLSQMRLKGVVSMDTYMGMLDKIYAPKPVVQWQNTLLIPKVVKSIKNNAKAKKAAPVKAAKKDTRAWYQKAWDGAKRFGEELDKKMIHEPTKFIKEHPWQAAGMAALTVGLVVGAIVSAPVALALGAAAVVMAGVSIYGIGKAYDQGGWNGVANNVFSKETRAMWNTGDIGGAAGRGSVELLGKALEIAPIIEAPKAAVTVMNGVKALPAVVKAAPQMVSNTISAVKAVGEIRVGIAIVDDAGVLNSGGVKVIKNLAKTAGEHIDAINPFIKTLPQNPGALAVVNNAGKDVVAAGKVGANESFVAEKKAGEIAGKLVKKEELNHTPITQKKFRELPATAKDLHQVQFTNDSYKVKADTSNFEEGSLQHVFEGEINKNGKLVGIHTESSSAAPPSRIIPDKPNVGPDEVYTGKVELYGQSKSTNLGKSTFFPKSWSKEKVVNEINSAFKNKKWDSKNNIWVGKSNSGVKIEMYLDPKTGKITAPRPKWPQ
jgi:ElaB/YqjD/DUF883 family membrane-anchored ribosome-binding protein